MNVRVTESSILSVELSPAEARALLNELADVPRGSKLPKIRQLCDAIESTLKLYARAVTSDRLIKKAEGSR